MLSVDHNWTKADHESSVKSREIHRLLSELNPRYHFIDNPDTDTAMKNFAATSNMDWLAIIPHKHSFFERLFHKSHTVEMIHNSRIPLIALHEIEKKAKQD